MSQITESDVKSYLEALKEILDESEDNLEIVKKTRTTDKTTEFMIENNIKHNDVINILKQLDVDNFVSKSEDYQASYGGYCWVFGWYSFFESSGIELYIKIKKNNDSRVICLSFHEAEYEMHYPFN